MSKTIENTMFYGAPPLIFERAKLLRESMTEPEKELWKILSSNKFMGLRFRAQHPIGKFIADFYCHSIKLVIEVDGGIHDLQENKEYDIQRTTEIENWDIHIVRFSNEQVLSDLKAVTNQLIKICTKRKMLFKVPFRGFRGGLRRSQPVEHG
jgi:very-short-patch-repair endonuclease